MKPSLPNLTFKLLSVTVQLGPGQKGNDDVWLWWSNSTKICNLVNAYIFVDTTVRLKGSGVLCLQSLYFLLNY